MREAFVTLPIEGRLAIIFSPSDSIVALSQYQSFSHLDNSRCMGMGGVTYVHTYTCVIIIPKFSNTTSVGKNWKFNQVRTPSLFLFSQLCAPAVVHLTLSCTEEVSLEIRYRVVKRAATLATGPRPQKLAVELEFSHPDPLRQPSTLIPLIHSIYNCYNLLLLLHTK